MGLVPIRNKGDIDMAVYRKNETWWIDIYIKGKRIRRKIGPDKETAELVEKDLKVKAANGEHLGIMEEHKIRFEDFAREYLEWLQANKAERTYKVDEHIINRRLTPFLSRAICGKHQAQSRIRLQGPSA